GTNPPSARVVDRLGRPRYLHSFPTRRSSDLICFSQRVGLPFASYLRLTGKWRNQLLESWRFYGRSLSSYSSGTSSCETSCVRTSDRKSTRLNSSHQIISYSVFCLQKHTRRY